MRYVRGANSIPSERPRQKKAEHQSDDSAHDRDVDHNADQLEHHERDGRNNERSNNLEGSQTILRESAMDANSEVRPEFPGRKVPRFGRAIQSRCVYGAALQATSSRRSARRIPVSAVPRRGCPHPQAATSMRHNSFGGSYVTFRSRIAWQFHLGFRGHCIADLSGSADASECETLTRAGQPGTACPDRATQSEGNGR